MESHWKVIETERERERERESERERERVIDRQTRQNDRDRQTYRHAVCARLSRFRRRSSDTVCGTIEDLRSVQSSSFVSLCAASVTIVLYAAFHTDRQTDGQTGRQTDRERVRERKRDIERAR